jgi:hypothetical protein
MNLGPQTHHLPTDLHNHGDSEYPAFIKQSAVNRLMTVLIHLSNFDTFRAQKCFMLQTYGISEGGSFLNSWS